MNAVATKPRAKTSRAKPAARASAAYVASTETDLRARLDTLQAALSQAEEHIESAYDAAEDGSAVEVLLDHLGHVLLADAMRPMMGTSPNRGDAQHAYSDLFLVTATLSGAMAMVAGTAIHPILQEAFELLDWAQNESNSQALIDLLPESTPTTSASVDDNELSPELLMNEAVGLNNLAAWVMSARDTLEALKLSAEVNPALETQLRKSDIRYRSPEWFGQGADEGMAYLLMYQRGVIEALGRGAA